MKIFFDTEFTGLHKDTTLISIGLIDEKGRTFYAEFSDYDDTQIDDWLHENVIKNLKWGKAGPIENFTNNDMFGNMEAYGTKPYIKKCLEYWLKDYDNVQLISDVSHYDMVLFIDLFGDALSLPSNISPSCHDINQDIARHYSTTEKKASNMSREGIIDTYNRIMEKYEPENKIVIEIERNKHNALYDARVIKEIYRITNGYQ